MSKASPADAVSEWSAGIGIPEGEIGLLARVVRLNMLVTRVLDDLVEPHGISVPDYLVLASIRRGQTSPAQLCRVLGRTTGGLSLTFDRLVAAGWVKRSPDPGDRRRIIVRLTPAGRSKAKAVNAALHDWEAELDLTPRAQAKIEADLDEVSALVSPRAVIDASAFGSSR